MSRLHGVDNNKLAFALTMIVLILATIGLSILGLRGADDTPLEGDKTSDSSTT